ncbi:MAG: glycosyltransferase [Alphaproteobacteria bacterium]|nr:glycosyltransferase [Alphaproteobacteria bacterium]
MNYYFLPGTGIYGGIKVAFQFADALCELGVKTVVATPGGEAPDWFVTQAPIVDRDAALANLSQTDVVLFSLPHDYETLRQTPASLVFHCQGTDPLIDPILADHSVTVLTCWQQAKDYAAEFGRQAIEVGISVSDCFFYDGTRKVPNQIAFMPRRGASIVDECAAAISGFEFVPIDGDHENVVARKLKKSTYYLATSVIEGFGLPALEAMAAGCVVTSVPVHGAKEYLIDQRSCQIADPAQMPSALHAVTDGSGEVIHTRLLAGARNVAANYRPSFHKRKLRDALNGRLQEALSWS